MTSIKQTVSDIDFLMRFWDSDKNTLDPYAVSARSEEPASWKCPKCGYAWDASIRARFRTGEQCPCCDKHKVFVPGISDFLTLVPFARQAYMFEKNTDINVEKHGVASTKSAWWKCPYCGNEYRGSFASRVDRTDSGYIFRRCNKCKHDEKVPENPISENVRFIKYWDYDKNRLSPSNVSIYSSNKMYWKCKNCGYDWYIAPKNMLKSEGCPCCVNNRVIRAGINDVAHFFPEIHDIFDESLNPDVNIGEQGLASTVPIKFHCKNCGHIWDSNIKNKIRRQRGGSLKLLGCPNCNNAARKRMSGLLTYDKEYPELAKMYEDDLNERSLESISSYEANELLLKWRCETCGEVFDSRVTSMISSLKCSTKGCPYCANTKLRDGESFADVHSELMDEYDPANKPNPRMVFPGCKTRVSWICRKDNTHTWKASFAERHRGGANCPVCNRTTLIKGTNTFADIYPELVQYWSDKNERKPDDIFYNSSLWFQWHCPDCGGDYGAYIKDRTKEDFECPYCGDRLILPGFNSLAVKNPTLAKCWAESNNVDADHVLYKASRDAFWICADCGGEYRSRLSYILEGKSTCPYCENRRALPGGNTLKAIYPSIAAMWSDSNELDSDHVLAEGSLYAAWICPTCNGEYNARIKDVVSQEADCPYCNNRMLLPGFNSFAERHEDLLSEWDYKNNYLLQQPTEVLDTSHDTAWWICLKDITHHYPMSIAQRIEMQHRNHEPCPYCKGRRVKLRHFS